MTDEQTPDGPSFDAHSQSAPPQVQPPPPVGPTSQGLDQQWYEDPKLVIASLFFCCFLSLILVWIKRQWDVKTKSLVTASAVFVYVVAIVIISLAGAKTDDATTDPSPATNSSSSSEAAQAPRTTSPPATTGSSTTTASPLPVNPITSPSLKLSGAVQFPTISGNSLAILTKGPFVPYSSNRGGNMGITFINQSGKTVYSVDVSATVRDAAGALVGTGRTLRVSPTAVAPGEWGVLTLNFEVSLPANPAIEFSIRGSSSPSNALHASVLEISTVQSGSRREAIGIFKNSTQSTFYLVSGDFYCLTADGIPVSQASKSQIVEIPPGSEFTIQSGYLSSNDCPVLVAAGTGLPK